MKIARRNLVLAGILVLLSAVHWAASSGRKEREVVRLFPELHPPLAARVGIESGDGARRLELALEDGTWVLPQVFGHPARASAVELLLDRVSALTDVDLVADRAQDHAAYGLTDGAPRGAHPRRGRTTLAALAQGEAAPAGLGDVARATGYARSDGTRVFPRCAPRAARASTLAWLDNRWLELDPSAVRVLRCAGASSARSKGRARPRPGSRLERAGARAPRVRARMFFDGACSVARASVRLSY